MEFSRFTLFSVKRAPGPGADPQEPAAAAPTAGGMGNLAARTKAAKHGTTSFIKALQDDVYPSEAMEGLFGIAMGRGPVSEVPINRWGGTIVFTALLITSLQEFNIIIYKVVDQF